MTREEFDSITTIEELLDAASDVGCDDIADSIYSSDARDDILNERMCNSVGDYTWREMLGLLNEWEDEGGYDWYFYNEWGDFRPITDGDDDFDNLKEELYEYMSENDYFEDDEEFDEEFVEEVEIEESMEDWASDDFKTFVSEFQVI